MLAVTTTALPVGHRLGLLERHPGLLGCPARPRKRLRCCLPGSDPFLARANPDDIDAIGCQLDDTQQASLVQASPLGGPGRPSPPQPGQMPSTGLCVKAVHP